MKRKKEITILLDTTMMPIDEKEEKIQTCLDYEQTKTMLQNEYFDKIATTCLEALSFQYAERLFASYKGKKYEITLGKCIGTKREISPAHNLKKLLLSGEFDWYKDGGF